MSTLYKLAAGLGGGIIATIGIAGIAQHAATVETPVAVHVIALSSPAPSVPVLASDGAPIRPDPILTPGALMMVNGAPVPVSELVKKGYANGSASDGETGVRDVPESTKNAVYAEYHVKPDPHIRREVDHRLPLCLGGDNSRLNLWIETGTSTWNFRVKDRLEAKIYRDLQAGKITLPKAQAIFLSNDPASDWIASYKARFPNDPISKQPTP